MTGPRTSARTAQRVVHIDAIRRWARAAFASALLAASAAACSPPITVTRPAPRRLAVRFEGARASLDLGPPLDPSEADCGACHEAAQRQWERSLHARAATDGVFAAAFRHEPRPSCLRCHAPRGDVARGVDCETCHVREGWVIGARRREGSPHRGPVDPSMATVDACAGCHQFDFPDEVDLGLEPSNAAMQITLTEWVASPAGAEGRACQSCHMAADDRGSGGASDHGFAVMGRPDMIRGAVAFDVEARAEDGATVVEVTLRAHDVGHAVPTGDLFRQLRLRAEASDGARVERTYARRFAPEPIRGHALFAALRRDAEDERLFVDEPRRERLRFAPGVEVEVTLAHLRMPAAVARAIGVAAAVNETPLYARRVRAPDP